MKKVVLVFSIILLSAIIAFFDLNYTRTTQPHNLYGIYLNGEYLGNIKSRSILENYINSEQQEIKKKYGVEKVYIPNGLEIKKSITYNTKIVEIEKMYENITKKGFFTIDGYQITIVSNNEKYKVFVLNKDIFKNAVELVMKSYVGTSNYEMYMNETQPELTDIGSHINKVYVDNDITIKETRISVNEKIYSNEKDLAQYLLFGNSNESKKYTVKIGDTIEQIAYNHEISVEEFLMSNSSFKLATSILSAGDDVFIRQTQPILNVTVEQRSIIDTETMYKTIEKFDENMVVGYSTVTQQGQKGTTRVVQEEKIVNGEKVYIKPISKEEIKPSVDKIIVRGSKILPNVGNLDNWNWPTESGWSISCPYGWRIHPIYHHRQFHNGLDIAGTGYGSKVFAANNGVVVEMKRNSSEGIYITINHNNGYYTRYLHLSRYDPSLHVGKVVSGGDVIGYVGSTGDSTGPHLHFSVWYGGMPYRSGSITVSPWTLYR